MTPQQRDKVDSLRGGGFVSCQSEYVKDYAAKVEGPLFFKNEGGIAIKVMLDGQLLPAGLPLKLADSPTRVNDFIVDDAPPAPAIGAGDFVVAAAPVAPIGDFIIAEDEVTEEEMKLPVAAVMEAMAGIENQKGISDEFLESLNDQPEEGHIVPSYVDVNGNNIGVGGGDIQRTCATVVPKSNGDISELIKNSVELGKKAVAPKPDQMTFAQRVQEFILNGYVALSVEEEQQLGDTVGMRLKGTDNTIVHIALNGDYIQINIGAPVPKVEKPREIAIGGTCNQNKKAQQLLDSGFTCVQEFFEIPNSPPNLPTHYMAPNGRIVAVNPKGQVIRPAKQTKPFPDGFFKYADDAYNEPIDEAEVAKKAQIEQIQKAIKEKKESKPEVTVVDRQPAVADNPKKTVKTAMDLLLKLGLGIKNIKCGG
jgi:hypothetical protein